MAYRPPLFTVSTPIPNILRDVTLYEDAWQQKITVYHPEMTGHLNDVEATIQAPTRICGSGTVGGNYVFVNEGVKDATGRSLRVAVKPVGVDGEVRSAYFSSSTTPGTVIWP